MYLPEPRHPVKKNIKKIFLKVKVQSTEGAQARSRKNGNIFKIPPK